LDKKIEKTIRGGEKNERRGKLKGTNCLNGKGPIQKKGDTTRGRNEGKKSSKVYIPLEKRSPNP